MNDKLEYWRKQIDKLDDDLLDILAKRLDIVREIGKAKRAQGIRLLDEKRWHEVLESKLSKAELLNLPKDLIETLYEHIHKHSLEIERRSK
jgi:chorismate mutase